MIAYTLPGPSTVTLEVVAPDGTLVTTLVGAAQLPAGGQSARWGGRGARRPRRRRRLHRAPERDRRRAARSPRAARPVSVIRAVRKLKLSRAAVGRNGAVTASWQQTQEASLAGELAVGGRAAAPPG